MDTYGLNYDPIELICGPFYSIRLLARRFALTLGFDRAREAAHLIQRSVPGAALSTLPPSRLHHPTWYSARGLGPTWGCGPGSDTPPPGASPPPPEPHAGSP